MNAELSEAPHSKPLRSRAARRESGASSTAALITKRSSAFICGCIALVVFSVSPWLRGKVHATCRCGAGELELVFVMDATSSMWPVIGTMKAQAERIVVILEGQIEKLKVGAIAFRTRDDKEMGEPAVCDLTADRKKLAEWFKGIHASGGGKEAVGDAMEAALRKISWSKAARKVIVLIGDEGPTPGGPEHTRFIALAEEAKSLGIVVNTVTASRTAWLYHMNWVRNTSAAETERILEKYGSIENLKDTFRIPAFEELAAAGGGRAVGTGDTREIVKWLLAFGLGAEDAEEPAEMPAPPPASKTGEDEAPARGRVKIGWVRYRGEWRTPRGFDGLARHLASIVRIDLDEEPEVVTLESKDLWRRPLLYLSGHGPVELSAGEREGLKKYVAAGGTVWADLCCGRRIFDETLRAELGRAFPDAKLETLSPSHPLFEIGHVIDEVRYTTAHRSREYVKRPPHVEAITVDGREAVLYTPHGVGAGWKTYEYGLPCMMHDDDALRLSENIILFAFSR